MDAILFWDRFKGRWLRGTEFHYPERPVNLPSLKTARKLAEIQSARHAVIIAGSRCVISIGLNRFAVHSLTAWYRQGADVQRLLPILSTYLGHSDLEGTKVYLSMTPELLQQASLRFARYAGGGQDA